MGEVDELMRYTICKHLRFAAAHKLEGYAGKCRFLHGHNYTVEVRVSASRLDALGMVVDFGRIKELFGQWLDEHWDHSVIRLDPNPTAEVMADTLFSTFQKKLPPGENDAIVESVRVWETEDSYAEARD